MVRPDKPYTGAHALVDALLNHNAATVYAVPGESYLAVLDTLYDRREAIRLVVCRQEGGAAFMAEAEGKLTGRPGICFVTRGPGACNAAIGLHTARQDSTPLILFMGQVGRGETGREAFQEIDERAVFGTLVKWAARIDDPARIPELVGRAFCVAVSGRPGPVVLGLPEDMLTEAVAGGARSLPVSPPAAIAGPVPGAEEMARLGALLAAAERPLVLAGGGGWNEQVRADMEAFVAAHHLPVATAFRRAGHIDNDHPCYVGDLGIGPNPALAERVRQADLLIAVGTRLDEMTTGGYSLIEAPQPRQTLVHVHPGAEELGRVFRPELAILAAPGRFAAAARALVPANPVRWAAATAAARADYLAWQEPRPCPGAVQMAEIVTWLRRRLPPEAILTNGAGNYSGWFHRYYRHRHHGTQLGPVNGAMGYAVPAAVAAKLAYPDRPVIAVTGDGDFLMTGQELATAIQYGAAIVVLVVNNGMYGTIRMHQERAYPGRVHGSALTNPDFAVLARAYGASGETVERTADFAPAFERALAVGRSALIEIRLDPEAITTRATLNEIRAATERAAETD